jgi:hypothetical protein
MDLFATHVLDATPSKQTIKEESKPGGRLINNSCTKHGVFNMFCFSFL